MIGRQEYQPQLFATVDIEKLVPQNHLLRKIDKVLDLSFIREMTSHLYCSDNGRPSIDPELFFRIYLLIFLFNIDSDRHACEELQCHLAYRWFCRLSLEDTVPDHSSLSKIRDRLGEETFKNIFEKIVNICFERGLIKGSKVMMDGSIVKADAALRSMVDRPKEGEKLEDKVPPKYIKGRKMGNEHQVSKTDPEATLAGKVGEPKKLAYKVHNMADRDGRVIVDTHVTTGADVEGKVMFGRIKKYESTFGKTVEEFTGDRGYGYAENLHDLHNNGINAFVPRFHSDSGDRVERDSAGFVYDKANDFYVCPQGHQLTAIQGPTPEYKRYRIIGGHCASCPLREACLNMKSMRTRNAKHIDVHIYHEDLERAMQVEGTEEFRQARGERQWKMEGLFAEAKNYHGLDRARYRSRSKMQIQAYMIAVVQNIKRLAASMPELTPLIAHLRRFLENRHKSWCEKIWVRFSFTQIETAS